MDDSFLRERFGVSAIVQFELRSDSMVEWFKCQGFKGQVL